MNQSPVIVFVCQHGAAKSIIAAAYFNLLAEEMGLNLRAIARGTDPDPELSPRTLKGLSEEGLTPTESSPRKLTEVEIESAEKVVAFCELPNEYRQQARVERWNDVPLVSENYEKARDVIVERVRQMLNP